MNKILKLLSVSCLALLMAMTMIIPTSAEEVTDLYEVTREYMMKELSIEDIRSELLNYNDEIRYELSMTSDSDKKVQLQQMSESLSELLNYVKILEEDNTSNLKSEMSLMTIPSEEEVRQLGYKLGKADAALVIAYFKNKGYHLSAELLTFATVNNSKNSIYYPTNGSKIRGSDFFYKLSTSQNHKDSSAFTYANSNMDLYYAIHKFDYTFTSSNKLVVISDYYDFTYEDNYGGLAGTAVRAMYNAQFYGAIVPFNVRISQYK